MITIIIVVYKSDKKLNEIIKNFNNFKIIIIDNSTIMILVILILTKT